MKKRHLPEFFYNSISVVGAMVSIAATSIFLMMFLMDMFVKKSTLYLGLITYVILPIFLTFGVCLIVIGAIWEYRRRARGQDPSLPKLIQIDLTRSSHRNILMVIFVGSSLFLLASSVGTYKAYKVTESVQFCGKLCHSVMKPEFTAYGKSSHARVSCVKCHIGPGAGWFVKSKMSGLYQVYATVTHIYPRPIPTPIKNLRPARETCLECHWPEKFFGERKDVNSHFLADAENTPYPITLLLKIGGGSVDQGRVEGIHWHMSISNKVEYIARDHGRQDIAWLRMIDEKGNITEYSDADNPLTAEEKETLETRTMDCMDCHNRPSHKFTAPIHAVNTALMAGWINRDLPYAKREAVKALDSEYPDTPTALTAIEEKLAKFYQDQFGEAYPYLEADVQKAVKTVQKIYQENFFPEMNVTWRKYPDNIGHSIFKGCFRCHGSSLETASGKRITQDCTTCHIILSQGTGPSAQLISQSGITFKHPVDIGGMEAEGNCTMCHSGGAELY